jgi:hypothetical protein
MQMFLSGLDWSRLESHQTRLAAEIGATGVPVQIAAGCHLRRVKVATRIKPMNEQWLPMLAA